MKLVVKPFHSLGAHTANIHGKNNAVDLNETAPKIKQEILVKEFNCNVCGVNFAMEKALKAHKLIFHRNFENLKESNKPNNVEDTSEGLNVMVTDDLLSEHDSDTKIDSEEINKTLKNYSDLQVKDSSIQRENQGRDFTITFG